MKLNVGDLVAFNSIAIVQFYTARCLKLQLVNFVGHFLAHFCGRTEQAEHQPSNDCGNKGFYSPFLLAFSAFLAACLRLMRLHQSVDPPQVLPLLVGIECSFCHSCKWPLIF
jgi:hypothetical protein